MTSPVSSPSRSTRPRGRHRRVRVPGTVVDTGKPFTQSAVVVLRVRDGEIVSSRDYFDHVTAAAIRGRLDDLVAAVKARGA